MNVRFLAVGSRLIRQANTFQRNMSAHAVSPCRVGAAAGVARQRLSQPFHRHQRPCTRWQHDGAYGSRGSSIARSSSQSIQQAPAGSLALLAPTLEATATLAELLAGEAQPGDCICLHGPIGAGKSAFSRAFIRAVTEDPLLTVPSPTFLLQLTYEDHQGTPVHHYDLYRLDGPSDLRGLDLADSFARAASLIEWPSRLGERTPASRLDVHIEYLGPAPRAAEEGDGAGDDAEGGGEDAGTPRRILLHPFGDRWRSLVASVDAHIEDAAARGREALLEEAGGLQVVE